VTAITGVPYQYMVWIIGIVFILYTAVGGLVSVAWTDLVQGVIMVASVVVALAYMLVDLGGLTEINTRFAEMNPGFVDPTGGGQLSWAMIGATFLAFFGTLFTEQDMLIRIAATKYVRTAKIHLAAAGAILSVLYSMLVLLGGATAVARVENAGAAFQTLIAGYVPAWSGAALVLGVMSAILSTTDTRLHAIGMTVARDMYSYFRPHVSEGHLMRVSRTATVVLGLLATAVA